MDIKLFHSMNELSDYASDSLVAEIKASDKLLLCAASGNSPTETYRKLDLKKSKISLDNLKVIKLDEWGGIPSDNTGSCESYLQNHLIKPLQIWDHNYFSFQSQPMDPEKECLRIQQLLHQNGPIDVCILGLGMNGHIAFNEPSDQLEPFCHVARLTESSMKHPMAQEMQEGSIYGLTLGMADILNSRKIFLIISGKNKNQIIRELMNKKINTHMPASFLWLHPNVHCLIDKETCDF
jgi:galactosamine-6-phosphate isomerase